MARPRFASRTAVVRGRWVARRLGDGRAARSQSAHGGFVMRGGDSARIRRRTPTIRREPRVEVVDSINDAPTDFRVDRTAAGEAQFFEGGRARAAVGGGFGRAQNSALRIMDFRSHRQEPFSVVPDQPGMF